LSALSISSNSLRTSSLSFKSATHIKWCGIT
jgi:hypothetical protein